LHLPSKIRSKQIVTALLFIVLLAVPFRGAVENVLIAFSRYSLVFPQHYLQRIKKLEAQNLLLQLKVKNIEHLVEENKELTKALELKSRMGSDIAVGEIVSFQPSAWRRVVVISGGKDVGISENDFAVDDQGYLVGRIIEVGRQYSRLMLVNDPDFRAAVFVGKEGEDGGAVLGMLRGSLDGVKVLYVENNEKVRAGDNIWLKSPGFIAPVYAGEVKIVKSDPSSLFLQIDVSLFADRPFLHRVFVLK